MVRTREELITALTTALGESPTDEGIALLEDVADTMQSLAPADGIDWKAEAERIDAEWRQKYINRFKGIEDEPVQDVVEEAPKTFEELFKEI